MKFITFKKIQIKNFLSIGEEPVIIEFKPGVNFITGTNSDVPGTKNGVGKSSIVAAFSFAIFGKTLKDLAIRNIPNNLVKGTTQVILEFNCNSTKGNNNFKIIRELNPSSLKVFKDGRDKTRDSIPNTTTYILEVLSTSQEVFKNCIAMQANNTVPFMSQGKTDKKKFIESLFNLDVVTQMFKLVKDDINISKRELDIESKLVEQINSNIFDYTSKQRKELERIANQKQKKELEKQIIEKDIHKISLKISKLKEEEARLSKIKVSENILNAIKNDIGKTREAQMRIAADLGAIKNEKKTISEKIDTLLKFGPVCAECNRPFTDKDQIEIKHSIKELQDKLLKKEEEKEKLNKLIALAQDIQQKKQKELNQLRDLEWEISNNKSAIKAETDTLKLKEDLLKQYQVHEKESEEKDIFKDLIEKAEKEKAKKEEVIKDINASLAKFEVARFILSEEGIRAYIIKKLLDLLNFRIKYYLTKQNSQYSLSFNEVFEEEILNKRGIMVSYGNLSGAESKMLDLACIWAFRDILKLQGSVSYNVSFYDEILDSSLDKTNSEIVCNILEEFAQKEDQAIYLISHKPDFFKAGIGEIIQLDKHNGITKRITI